jgi:hypothetical protein
MYSTLDILLMNRREMESDLMNEWESELEKLGTPKLKFPLKVIESDLDKIDLNFIDPTVSEPRKKEIKNPQEVKTVDLAKKRNTNKKDKTKLF